NPQASPVLGIVQPPVVPAAQQPGRNTNVLKHLAGVLRSLFKIRSSRYFRYPVDTIALNIPNYYDVVKHAMDLTTIKRRLRNNYYWNANDALADFEQIFDNCRLFFARGTKIEVAGRRLREQFYRRISQVDMDNEVPRAGTRPRVWSDYEILDDSDSDSESEGEPEVSEEKKVMETVAKLHNWNVYLIEKFHCQKLLHCLTKRKRRHINWPFNSIDLWSGYCQRRPYNHEIFRIDWHTLNTRLKSNEFQSFNDFVRVISLMFHKARTYLARNKLLIRAVKRLDRVLRKRVDKYRYSILTMKSQSSRYRNKTAFAVASLL
ncbi:hypothetical protein KR093_003455, partial [Drosophila rubida]